jgi:hypothetical protein
VPFQNERTDARGWARFEGLHPGTWHVGPSPHNDLGIEPLGEVVDIREGDREVPVHLVARERPDER